MTDLEKHINYWKETSARDLETASGLFELGRYDSCLFFCHLSLEKILKGLVVFEIKKTAPYIHDLERLLNLSKIKPDNNAQLINLKTITEFNISGRYPEIKSDFYKQCTRKYTEKYFNITKELYKWLEKKYLKN